MPSLLAPQPDRITYWPDGESPVFVHRVLNLSAANKLAQHVTGLMISDFSHRFEYQEDGLPDETHPLSPGSVDAKFGTTDARTQQQTDLEKRLVNSGNCWLVSDHNSPHYILDEYILLAFASTRPYRDGLMQWLGRTPANCRLDNLLVSHDGQLDESQRLDLKKMVMHAAINSGGFQRDRSVIADIPASNPDEVDFYREAGLKLTDDYIRPMKFPNRQRVPVVRLIGDIDIVLETMEGRSPWLANAQSVNRN